MGIEKIGKLKQVRFVAGVKAHVTTVTGQGSPDIWTLKPMMQGAESTGAFAEDSSVDFLSAGIEFGLHKWEDFINQPVFIMADSRAVHILVPAEAGERIRKDNHAIAHLAGMHQTVDALWDVF